MSKYYWYKACPRCGFSGGGRLTIFEDLTNHCLYLHCDECEWGWRDPQKADDLSAAFLTLTESFEAHLADWHDIERYSWEKYALNFYEE